MFGNQEQRYRKKAARKNKVKKIKANKVLLLKKNPLSDFAHLSNNISTILYDKKQLDLNTVSDKELIEEVISAKYIFFDELDSRLSPFLFTEQELIFVPFKLGIFSEEKLAATEEDKELVNKITKFITSSEVEEKYYQQKYQLEDLSVFARLGNINFDKYATSKWEQGAAELAEHFPQMLTNYNVYFLPRDITEVSENQVQVLLDTLPEQVNLIILTNQRLNLDDNRLIMIDVPFAQAMIKLANLVITDGNELVFHLADKVNNLIILEPGSESFPVINLDTSYPLTFNPQEFIGVNKGTTARDVILDVMRLV